MMEAAESISSHDKDGNSWPLQEGHGVYCMILIKIIAPILLSGSIDPLTARLSGELLLNTFSQSSFSFRDVSFFGSMSQRSTMRIICLLAK